MRGSVSRWDWRLEGMSCLPAIESVCVRVEPGRNGVAFSGFVKTHPSACFCSKRSHISIFLFFDVFPHHSVVKNVSIQSCVYYVYATFTINTITTSFF